jgi:Tol biopolymer transport system component
MKRLAIFVLVALTTMVSAQVSPAVAFRRAMETETVKGDLKAAIQQYQHVVESGDRALAAQALVRMAECHRKMGDNAAREIYERVLREFRDQQEPVRLARARLESALSNAARSNSLTLRALPNSNVSPGTVSADGRYFTFVSWDDGNLYLRDLTTGVDRAITKRDDFSLHQAAISRDNRFVAFSASARGCDGKATNLGPAALCLVTVEGPAIRPVRTLLSTEDIGEIAPMDWSPDGRTIAVSLRRRDRSAQIGLVTVASGSLNVLHSLDWRGPNRIFFSPDGRDVVFDLPVSDTSEHRHVVMLSTDGARSITAAAHPSQNIAMGWTPDGSELLFASDRGGSLSLWAQLFEDRQPRGLPRLIRSDIGGAWSAGVTRGGALYFSVRRSDRDVIVGNLDLQTGMQVATPTRPIQRYVGTNLAADWSPDGKQLAYISQRGFNPTNNTGRIIGIRSMADGVERELYPKLLYFGPLDWAPDGRALLTAGTDIKGRTGVFEIDVRSGEAALVVEAPLNAHPQWSPDRRHIFYRRTPGDLNDWTLIERNLSSGAERAIARGAFGFYSVSPDGTLLVATVGGVAPARAPALAVIRVDTGEVKELLRVSAPRSFPPYIAPQWTPDGRSVLVIKRAPNELWLVPTNGAPRKIEVDDWGWGPGSNSQMSIHPDGRQITYLGGVLSTQVVVLENFLPSPVARR